MAFKIDTKNLQKPSSFDDKPLEDGLHDVAVELCEYKESNSGNMMLSLRYKTLDTGKFVFDQIMDDPTKQINAYRLGRLLAALGIELTGEVSLKDLTKIIKQGQRLTVALVTKPGSQFTNIDINKFDGYYPIEKKNAPQPEQELNLAAAEAAAEESVEFADTDEEY